VENIGARVYALKFGVAQCRVVMHEKYWCMGVHTKFSIARCELSGACIILACAVGARIIMLRMVCSVLIERRGILFVHAQCWYMLSRKNLVIGVQHKSSAHWLLV